MVRNITGHGGGARGPDAAGGPGASESKYHCTPEMITKYVEKLKEQKKRLADKQPGFKNKALADTTTHSRKLK